MRFFTKNLVMSRARFLGGENGKKVNILNHIFWTLGRKIEKCQKSRQKG